MKVFPPSHIALALNGTLYRHRYDHNECECGVTLCNLQAEG